MLITRIAPTPSGYLHLGNAVNFLLTDWVARAEGGRLILRIDDMDTQRLRPQYLDDIFQSLAWLGITPDQGPRDRADFEARYRLDPEYLQAELRKGDLPTYACSCSRRELAARPPGTPDPCRDLGRPWRPGENALRLRMDPASVVEVNGLAVRVAAELPDFVLWRRDDQPSYQLASVITDRDLGVNTVVRGSDLMASTAAQLLIARALGAAEFARARFIHHDLVRGPGGVKLSKSRGASGLRDLAGLPTGRAQVLAAAATVARGVGITLPGHGSLEAPRHR
ncbi:MAG: glutamate--tRNA ligase family protein [Candidatus Nanopelagicales bacterium]